MASFDSNSTPCQIVRRSCNLRPVCSQCGSEKKAARCFHCTAHGHTYKLCTGCYQNRYLSVGFTADQRAKFDPTVLAESWCRLQRGKGIHRAADWD